MDPTFRLPWDWGSEIVEKSQIAYTLKLGDLFRVGEGRSQAAKKIEKRKGQGKT